MLNSLSVIITQDATWSITHETRKVTTVHERCDQIFNSQTHNGGCISFIIATLLTHVTIKTLSLKYTDMTSSILHWHRFILFFLINSLLSPFIPLRFSPFHFLFIIIFGNPLHRHRYSSSSVSLFIIAINISVFCLLFRLFTSSSLKTL